jgi:osmoprotectant transport system ATP-binding protein
MSEAAFVAGEMAIMRAGKVLQRGSFQDLARNPADPFVTEFIRAQRPFDLAMAPGA